MKPSNQKQTVLIALLIIETVLLVVAILLLWLFTYSSSYKRTNPSQTNVQSLTHVVPNNDCHCPPVTPCSKEIVPLHAAQPVRDNDFTISAGSPDSIHAAQIESWFIENRIKEVEARTVLSEEDKNSLRAKLTKGDLLSPQNKLVLEEVLGAERSVDLNAKLQSTFDQERRDRIEQEALSLTRKLSLSPEQEQAVSKLLEQVDSQTAAIQERYGLTMESVGAEHTVGGGNKASIQQRYAEMMAISKELKSTRNEILTPALKQLLNDDQFNRYLELTAKQSSSVTE